MKTVLVTHLSSIICLFLFIFLAVGSFDEGNNPITESYNSYPEESGNDEGIKESSNEEKIEAGRIIAPLEEQRRIVKSFRAEVSSIEKPATIAIDKCRILTQQYVQEKLTSFSAILQAKYAKKKCKNAMIAFADLPVPNNLPDEVELLLKDAKQNMKLAYSTRATTYDNLIDYLQGDTSSINYFNLDMQEAQEHIVLAVSKLTTAYNRLGIIDDLVLSDGVKQTDEEPQQQINKEENYIEGGKEHSKELELKESKMVLETEFNILRESLLQNLGKCNEMADGINSSTDRFDIDSYKAQGEKHYNLAYNDFIKIQDPIYDIPRNKTDLISRALKYYARGFRDIGKVRGPYVRERREIHQELDGWPYSETQAEKNLSEGVVEIDLPAQTSKSIVLPTKGNWCIIELASETNIWLEGYVYNSGFGKYRVTNEELPKYLANEKEFIIRNDSFISTSVIFKMCELDR